MITTLRRMKSGRWGRFFVMTEREYRRRENDNEGLCIACGGSMFGIEPDAEKYVCEECTKPAGYGLERLLMARRIEIKEEA